MRVKVHPNKTMVNGGVEACVSITPDKKHGRAYYMGTVILSDVSFRIHQSGVARSQAENVRNVHAWAVGEILSESVEQNRPSLRVLDNMQQVTYHFVSGEFRLLDGTNVSDKTFKAAMFIGRDFFVSKD